MNFSDGLEQALLEQDAPIITDYEFFLLGRDLLERGEWKGERLLRRPQGWDHTRARNATRRLDQRSAIAPDADFRSGVRRIVQSTRSGSAEEVVCIADPFCYVSHLSAMQRYGVTNRSPEALHVTIPARPIWNAMRDRKVASDRVGANMQIHPPLLRIGFKETIRRRPVAVHETMHPAEPVGVRGERTRMTSIGRTFVDMLTEPHLCGGIRHVLEVWEAHAEDWVQQIIEDTDKVTSKIVKVRAGYLLSEVLHISDPRVDSWEKFAQRGGSRKLDPDAPYAPTFSERWMLSLNV